MRQYADKSAAADGWQVFSVGRAVVEGGAATGWPGEYCTFEEGDGIVCQ